MPCAFHLHITAPCNVPTIQVGLQGYDRLHIFDASIAGAAGFPWRLRFELGVPEQDHWYDFTS